MLNQFLLPCLPSFLFTFSFFLLYSIIYSFNKHDKEAISLAICRLPFRRHKNDPGLFFSKVWYIMKGRFFGVIQLT